MWSLYLTAKMARTRPSSLVAIEDQWAALQFDNAVRLIGTAIENASQEMIEVGIGKNKTMQPKYRIAQLLDADFKLPRPKSDKDLERAGVSAFVAMVRAASKGGKAKIEKVE